MQGIDVGLTRVLTSPSLGHAVGLTSRTSLDGASVRYIPGNSKLHSCFSSSYIRYFLLTLIQLSHLRRVLFVVYLAFLQLIEFLFHPSFPRAAIPFHPLVQLRKQLPNICISNHQSSIPFTKPVQRSVPTAFGSCAGNWKKLE